MRVCEECCDIIPIWHTNSQTEFNIKNLCYHHRNFQVWDKMVVRLSYPYNGYSSSDKMTPTHCISALELGNKEVSLCKGAFLSSLRGLLQRRESRRQPQGTMSLAQRDAAISPWRQRGVAVSRRREDYVWQTRTSTQLPLDWMCRLTLRFGPRVPTTTHTGLAPPWSRNGMLSGQPPPRPAHTGHRDQWPGTRFNIKTRCPGRGFSLWKDHFGSVSI